jgi:hypothetical protein
MPSLATSIPHRGLQAEIKDQPHAIAYALEPTLWGENQKREALPFTSDGKRTVPDARGTVAGRAEGK